MGNWNDFKKHYDKIRPSGVGALSMAQEFLLKYGYKKSVEIVVAKPFRFYGFDVIDLLVAERNG